ncbi:DUF1129 domain-containing protein [Lapidilactobacillus luobeiensis]|uniref:DUF1129 domain-containing protein n=1 Tax=Lapidilactobacillus luobeiensis TaxID=2950371 RepID=UPI0021C37CE2|nr:DUF1129 family protein [Lapidilactobacillus luobeiensis]
MKANEENNQQTPATDDTKATGAVDQDQKKVATSVTSTSAKAEDTEVATSADQDKNSAAADDATAPAETATDAKNDDNTSRNQAASAKQAKVRSERRRPQGPDPEEMSPAELRAELTNKNDDYVFKMHKLFVDAGYTEADADKKIDEFLPEIVAAQRIGKPAAQIYGAPTVKVDHIIHAPAKPIEIKYWMRSVDWSLLYFVILAVVFGVMGLFTKTNAANNSSSGFLTLLTMSLAFGFLLTWFTDGMAESQAAKKAGRKPSRPLWRTILISVVAVFAVMTLISFLSVLLPGLNIVLPGWAYLLLAAAAYGLRYLFRRHYHIKGNTMF